MENVHCNIYKSNRKNKNLRVVRESRSNQTYLRFLGPGSTTTLAVYSTNSVSNVHTASYNLFFDSLWYYCSL